MSQDPVARLKQHNDGKTKSTKGYIPWKLVFEEKYLSRKDAREREKYLKSGSGKEKIKHIWSHSSAG